MGVVYSAHDAVLRQSVAVKMLSGVGARAADWMKHEFRALADVAHPNLVTLHELFFDEGRWFFTMELIDGRTLDEHFRHSKGMDYHDIAEKFRQLATGIAALHEASKLHRDLKPSNVMVRRDGRVAILDFGLVEDLRGTEAVRSVSDGLVGTPAYMAPEQIIGDACPASDWYAFGVMLYEVLAGEPPFSGSVQEVLAAKCNRVEPSPPSSRRAGIPPVLEKLCTSLLAGSPAQRPAPSRIFEMLGGSERRAPIVGGRDAEIAPFVGREAELKELKRAHRALKMGRPRAMLLHGPSGMGKSTLVHRFLDEVQGKDETVVLRGRCYERESVPYKAFDGILDALIAHLCKLSRTAVELVTPRNVEALRLVFPVFRQVEALLTPHHRRLPVDAHELRQAAFLAMKELLARVADRAPLVLFIDDMQWADPDSVQLASAVFAPPDPPAVLLIGCYRQGAHGSGPLVAALSTSEPLRAGISVRELPIESLSVDELTRVAAAWVDDAERARRAAIEAAGSPLFATELARFARASAADQVTLQSVIRGRLGRLPRDARDILDLIAVAGRPVAVPLLKSAAGSKLAQAADVYAIVHLLRTHQLVRTTASADESLVEAYHDRIVDAVLSELDAEAARNCHLALAHAFEAAGNIEPQILATHFLEAGIRDKARRYAIEAGDAAAAALAFGRAAHWYAAALDIDQSVGDADDLRVRLADALALAGRGAEAAMHYFAVASRRRGQHALELRRRAADQWLRTGHFAQGFDALSALLADVGLPRYSSTLSALPRLVKNRLQLRLAGYDFDEREPAPALSAPLLKIDACRVAATAFTRINFVIGSTYAAELVLLALQAGEPARIAHGLCTEAMFLATEGVSGRMRAVELLDRAEQLIARTDDPALLGYYELSLGCVELLTGHWLSAISALERAEQTLRERCVGVSWELGFARTLWIPAVQLHRSLDEPTPRIEEWLRDARDSRNLEVMRQLLVCRAYSFLAADRPEDAARSVAEGLALWVPQELDTTGGYALFCESSRVHYTRASRSELLAHLARFDPFWRSALSRAQFLRGHAEYYAACTELALAMLEPHAAKRRIRSATKTAYKLRNEGVEYGNSFGLIILAQAAYLRGDRGKAAARIEQAANSAERGQQFIVAACCRYWYGRLRGGRAGRDITRAADRELSERGCQRPERIAASYVPVFDRAELLID